MTQIRSKLYKKVAYKKIKDKKDLKTIDKGYLYRLISLLLV